MEVAPVAPEWEGGVVAGLLGVAVVAAVRVNRRRWSCCPCPTVVVSLAGRDSPAQVCGTGVRAYLAIREQWEGIKSLLHVPPVWLPDTLRTGTFLLRCQHCLKHARVEPWSYKRGKVCQPCRIQGYMLSAHMALGV